MVWVTICCDLLENNYLCSISINLPRSHSSTSICCDLLENNYLCSISNNLFQDYEKHCVVVICLKTTTFAVSATTQEAAGRADGQL